MGCGVASPVQIHQSPARKTDVAGGSVRAVLHFSVVPRICSLLGTRKFCRRAVTPSGEASPRKHVSPNMEKREEKLDMELINEAPLTLAL